MSVPPRVPVFLVGQDADGEFHILTAMGYPVTAADVPKPGGSYWNVKRGCFIELVPAGLVYHSKQAAEIRVTELKAEAARNNPQ